jgi:hypothetical protein
MASGSRMNRHYYINGACEAGKPLRRSGRLDQEANSPFAGHLRGEVHKEQWVAAHEVQMCQQSC